LDRIDFVLPLKNVSLKKEIGMGESSSVIRERVTRAREMQYKRYGERILNNRVPFQLIQTKWPIRMINWNTCRKFAGTINGAIEHQNHTGSTYYK
jgi:predicted ATPase with chaperone activity